jgi:hypothetical protein
MTRFQSIGALLAGTLLFLAASALIGGCGDDPLAPFEPEVSNAVDSFSLQATGVQGVSLTRNYTWQNTGTSANLNQATTVSKGSATLTLLDADGTQVYQGDLADNGTFSSETGTSGAWTIRLRLSSYSGTVNFTAEKP